MATYTVDTAADIASQNGAARWWDALLAGALPPSSSTTGGGSIPTSLQGLFGASAPTGPALPAGTVSPLSDLFSQIPTGLANNSVTHTPNNNISMSGGPLMLPVGSQWTPRPGYSIVYGMRQGVYGHYQIPDSDLSGALDKYGIQVMGAPLSQQDINYHNNPKGGPQQTGVVTVGSNGQVLVNGQPTGSGGGTQTNTPPIDTTTGGGQVTTPPTGGGQTTPPPPSGPQLPALNTQRQSYLDAIDRYIRSQSQYQYAPTITDEMRRAMNLPGMAELQMNQAANPQFNAANFSNVTSADGLPFIPGSAAPDGFKWKWWDPDGSSGLAPANYTLEASSDIFNKLPGNLTEDLQAIVNTFNDPKFANKYLSTDGLGIFGNLLSKGTGGNRYQLAPQESLNQVMPLLEREDIFRYIAPLLNSVSGQLGSSYAPGYNFFRDINDPQKLQQYFGAANDALSLNFLPTIGDVLGGTRRTLDDNQFYQGRALDFYSPQTKAPAFFQYLLEDRDGAGALPSTYGLRMMGAPNTKYDAEQILQTLNNSNYRGMINPQSANINPSIFTQIMGMDGNPLWKLLDAYKFPGGQGGPAGQQTTTGTGGTGTGAPGGPALMSERWMPTAQDTINANKQAADMAENTSKQASLYGGGDGTAGLGSTPPPSTPPPGGSTLPPNPFAGTTPPATTTDRKPSFFTPYSYWT